MTGNHTLANILSGAGNEEQARPTVLLGVPDDHREWEGRDRWYMPGGKRVPVLAQGRIGA